MSEGDYLTPGHFLIGKPLRAPPESDFKPKNHLDLCLHGCKSTTSGACLRSHNRSIYCRYLSKKEENQKKFTVIVEANFVQANHSFRSTSFPVS